MVVMVVLVVDSDQDTEDVKDALRMSLIMVPSKPPPTVKVCPAVMATDLPSDREQLEPFEQVAPGISSGKPWNQKRSCSQ